VRKQNPRPERLQWRPPPPALPRRPYRDSAILYGVLAVVIVVIAWATGGGLARAIGFAVAFFVAATAWSFWQWRGRLRKAAAKDEVRHARAPAHEEQMP
jgi:hypothetical protein